MANFAASPPKGDPARICCGGGCTPLLQAAANWDVSAGQSAVDADSFTSVTTDWARDVWHGPTASSMAAPPARYASWFCGDGQRASAMARQSGAAADAFGAAACEPFSQRYWNATTLGLCCWRCRTRCAETRWRSPDLKPTTTRCGRTTSPRRWGIAPRPRTPLQRSQPARYRRPSSPHNTTVFAVLRNLLVP